MSKLPTLLAATGAALLVISAPASTLAVTVESEPQPLGDGTARTYVELDNSGQPIEVGVIITESALSDLPDDRAEVVLLLPEAATATGLTHIGLNWQPHGHPPDAIYHLPHLDVHAYTITPDQRAAITLDEPTLAAAYVAPDPTLVPAGYVLAPNSAEPHQGTHWVDPTSAEFQGQPHGFEHTLIYGFYDGAMSFIEPMVTMDFLNSRQSIAEAIAVPQRYSRSGAYPTGYRITYNDATDEHVIALTGFTQP